MHNSQSPRGSTNSLRSRVPCATRSIAAALLLCGAAEAQSLLRVQVGGGAPYGTIQTAINAAVDGDVILVGSGTYLGSMIVNNKALTIIEDAGATVIAVSAQITNPNGKTVAIRGIDFVRNSPATSGLVPGARNLEVIDNTGTVWIEDCTFKTGGTIMVQNGPTYPAIESHTVNAVAGGTLLLTRCTVEGADSVSGHSILMEPSVAILANDRAGDHLLIYDSMVRGGDGAVGIVSQGWPGSSGGDGIAVGTGTVFTSGGSSTGGLGGAGGVQGGSCTSAGWGGDGIEITGPAVVDSLATAYAGGAGGAAILPCTPGTPGVPTNISGAGGVFNSLTVGVPHSMTVTAPVLDNTSTTATYTGAAGSTVTPYYSAKTGFVVSPLFTGPMVLDPVSFFSLGPVTLNAAGTNTTVYPLTGILTPPVQAAVLYMQSVEARGTSNIVGAPSLLVVR
jgi:hypothetical protein